MWNDRLFSYKNRLLPHHIQFLITFLAIRIVSSVWHWVIRQHENTESDIRCVHENCRQRKFLWSPSCKWWHTVTAHAHKEFGCCLNTPTPRPNVLAINCRFYMGVVVNIREWFHSQFYFRVVVTSRRSPVRKCTLTQHVSLSLSFSRGNPRPLDEAVESRLTYCFCYLFSEPGLLCCLAQQGSIACCWLWRSCVSEGKSMTSPGH